MKKGKIARDELNTLKVTEYINPTKKSLISSFFRDEPLMLFKTNMM